MGFGFLRVFPLIIFSEARGSLVFLKGISCMKNAIKNAKYVMMALIRKMFLIDI